MASILRRAVTTPAQLRELRRTPQEAPRLDAPGRKDAAVLVPQFFRAGEAVPRVWRICYHNGNNYPGARGRHPGGRERGL